MLRLRPFFGQTLAQTTLVSRSMNNRSMMLFSLGLITFSPNDSGENKSSQYLEFLTKSAHSFREKYTEMDLNFLKKKTNSRKSNSFKYCDNIVGTELLVSGELCGTVHSANTQIERLSTFEVMN